MEQLNKALYENNLEQIYSLCKKLNLETFLSFLPLPPFIPPEDDEDDGPVKVDEDKPTTLKLLCNWSDNLKDEWSKMLPSSSSSSFGVREGREGEGGGWILLDSADERTPDYWVIINAPPPGAEFVPSRTIVFQMEPYMDASRWGEWAEPKGMLRVFSHKTDYNNIEWHLGLTYDELLTTTIDKRDEDTVSVILSPKMTDRGHLLRNAFVEHLLQTSDLKVDVFGNNKYKNTTIELPPGRKEQGLFPYKYHFAAENNSIHNYFTEKVVDAILSECLCFYWGCPNISSYIDPRAYIHLDIRKPQESLEIMRRAIKEGEWEKRIELIREVKRKLITEMNMFARIKNII